MNPIILTNNSVATAVNAAGIIPLGSAIHGCGKAIRMSGNDIVIKEPGYYKVTANITADVTAATALKASMMVDGEEVVSSSATPAAAGRTVNITLIWILRKCCPCGINNVTFVLDSAANVTEFTVEVIKL